MCIRNFVFWLVCLLVLSSCAFVKTDKNFKNTRSYSAVLPCASCEGIKQILTLKDDNTYVLQSIYLGEKDVKFKDSGSYIVEKNIITTKSKFNEISYYKIEGVNLRLLDNNKKSTNGSLNDLYIFKPYNK